ncbi:hypothetical protein ES708_23303 [subsurface metagenome]
MMFVPVPEQILPVPPTVKPIAGKGSTVTTSVSVNSAEQLPRVAYTLKVVVDVKFPVGKLINPPVPATGPPTLLSSKSSLNW